MKLYLHLLLIFFPMVAFSQEVETVKIDKSKIHLFRGQSQEIRNCYIFVDSDGMYYLATLQIQEKEVLDWFNKRKDSQSLYKGILENGQYKVLSLTKDNEPGASISFYYSWTDKSELQLISFEDGRIYRFKLVSS